MIPDLPVEPTESQLRVTEFESVKTAIEAQTAFSDDRVVVAHGDSLEMLRRLPDRSVSLILTDPPYHSTKKANIVGDTDFVEDTHFVEWIELFAREWKRVLKLSGSLYMFCATEMSARLEVAISGSLRPVNHVVWTKPNEPGFDGWKGKMKKESLRSWYPHSERILVFEQGSYGSREAYRRSPMGEYLLDARKAAGLTMVHLTELAGAYGKINRGGAVANWEAGRNIPSREQYAKIREAMEKTGKVGRLLDYEDLVRPMNVSKNVEFTDVWNFMSVRPFRGKHPAEKPLDMLEHIISASSYPDDLVLDCFAGSGSTAVAAVGLGRRSVAMEIERRWVERAVADLSIRRQGYRSAAMRAADNPESDQMFALDGLFD